MIKGNIHSIETFGTVDGPGIRLVVFLQGCIMRCKFCHNPDTWNLSTNKLMSPNEIIALFLRNKEFYIDGGITVSGGEPLLQIDFLIELFKKCKKENIHTCLDTSGITFDKNSHKKFDKLIKYTSLVLLDIKHIDPNIHKDLTGFNNQNVIDFARYLDENNVKVIILHVVLKSYLLDMNNLRKLGKFLSTLKNIEKIEVLPYHTLGVEKYKKLEIPYPLEGMNDLTINEAQFAKDEILKGYYDKN